MAHARLLIVAVLILTAGCSDRDERPATSEPNLLSYSRVEQAHQHSRGDGVVVAILDWQFDLKGREARKYIHPTSLVPGEAIGELKPWHGEWMAEIVHAIAPETKIVPIKARGLKHGDYQENVHRGIRLAADLGAAAVTCSMGPVLYSAELAAAVAYAEERGTVFVNVHPEIVISAEGERGYCKAGDCDKRIIRTGVVAVPEHPVDPEPNRDIYVWAYDLEAHWEDGWGYSNGPPTVAGVIALMRAVNPDLAPARIRQIIAETAVTKNKFAVLDAEAAVKKAIASKQ